MTRSSCFSLRGRPGRVVSGGDLGDLWGSWCGFGGAEGLPGGASPGREGSPLLWALKEEAPEAESAGSVVHPLGREASGPAGWSMCLFKKFL